MCTNLNVPKVITQFIAQYVTPVTSFSKIGQDIMKLVIKYLKHHNGKTPAKLLNRFTSVKMEKINVMPHL